MCLQPDDSLYNFKGPRALYWQEAKANLALYRSADLRKCVKRLETRQFLTHWNPDPKYQVPHITHWDKLSMNEAPDRLDKAVAVISNCGPLLKRLLKNSQSINLRTEFAISQNVDLFGNRKIWSGFRKSIFSLPKCPDNYRGEIPGSWGASAKLNVISKYKAMVCLENAQEPNYFTEKFVDAVRAGCIPIYNAHETVRNGILKDAKWVDPSDFKFRVNDTLRFAFAENVEDYRDANRKWLESDAVTATNFYAVFKRIGDIFLNEK